MEIIIGVVVGMVIYFKGRADGRKALKRQYDALKKQYDAL